MNNLFLKFIENFSKYDIDIKNNYETYRKIQNKSPLAKIKKPDLVTESNMLFNVFKPKKPTSKVLIYIHGGGWSVGSTSNYNSLLNKLAKELNRNVISIDYPLAPEHPFPEGFNYCYEAIKIIFKTADKYKIKMDDCYIMGDSAGANLATSLSLKAKQTKDFKIAKEILIYPIVQTNFDNNKKCKSIEENGYKYFLTKKMIKDYLSLYLTNKKDYKNKYVAPLHAKWLFNMPKTLIITADLDPLRDEGYLYAKKLKRYFNTVTYYNMPKVIHGFINNPIYHKETNKVINLIKYFGGNKNESN
ncbi:MAG: alpha/beta hydrolase [Ruminococcus sp.]|nr:alpha/beta hydrolase [Ruminococcus sp.]